MLYLTKCVELLFLFRLILLKVEAVEQIRNSYDIC